MASSLARFVLVLGLVGVAGSAAPGRAGAHWRTDDLPASGHHRHHDHQGANDTGAADQCPNCPPAECRRHSECDSGGDSAMVAAVNTASPPATLQHFAMADPDRPGLRSAPPTPPPQTLR